MSVNNAVSYSEKCTGCGACAAKCAKHAIKLSPDKEGFIFPEIDEQLCINCGACAKVCPIDSTQKNNDDFILLSGYSTDDEVRSKSSSGGVFAELANYIINQGGIVFGVAFDSKLRQAVYCDSDNVPVTDMMRSKYVEATDDKCFEKVKTELERGRKVLFSGTPCKIAGLNLFLGKNYDNLITADFACHGKPSPKLLKDVIEKEESTVNDRCIDVTFREKRKGWRNLVIAFYFAEHSPVIYDTDYYYYHYFLNNYSVRLSCVTCEYYKKHQSDLTLADYWTVSKDKDDNSGTSLVMVNSEKGKNILDEVSDRLHLNKEDNSAYKFDTYAHTQKRGYSVKKRNKFYQMYLKRGIDYIKDDGYEVFRKRSSRKNKYLRSLAKIKHLIK